MHVRAADGGTFGLFAEWFKASVLKAEILIMNRGFESLITLLYRFLLFLCIW